MLVAMLAVPAGAKSVKKKTRTTQPKTAVNTRVDLDKGVEAYNNEDLSTALSYINKYVASTPSDVYGWVYLAAIKSDLNQPHEALEAIEKARECDIDENNTYMLNWLHYTRSTIHLQLKDTISAIDDLNMALRFDDKDFDCYVRRGNLYRKLHRYDEAMADYGYMVQLDPTMVEGYLGIGTIADSQGKRKEAIKAYTKAIELEPDLADPYAMRATDYYNEWDYDKAVKDVISALERDKDNWKALNLLERLKEEAPKDVAKRFKEKAKKTDDPSWLDLIQ